MIENFNCELTRDAFDSPIFRFRWKWNIHTGEIPKLRVLYRSIGESEILLNSLFSSDAITSHMFKGMTEATMPALLANGERYHTMECSLHEGGSIIYEGDIAVDSEGCVYFFYFVNNNGVVFQSLAKKALRDSKVEYSETRGRFGNSKTKIVLSRKESRRILLQTKEGGHKLYSLLPAGYKEYYIRPEIRNYDLVYLTSLVNIRGCP